MLNSLEIRNYRNLKQLKIDKLGRVNLIVGKNNTGKSSVLEALNIYGSKIEINVINSILDRRQENCLENETSDVSSFYTHIFLKNIFTNQNTDSTIHIGDDKNFIDISLTGLKVDFEDILLEIKRDNANTIKYSLTKGDYYTLVSGKNYFFRRQQEEDICQYVRPDLQDLQDASRVNWSNISLNLRKESFLIEGLKLLESSIEKFDFITVRKLNPVLPLFSKPTVRLKNGNIVNLRSMGDGINRILTIILAMVNCENGYLLIDEFENGLHYSVQEKLWEIIFQLAERLNIQVFATTHSYDCIEAFSEVLNSGKHAKESGVMIRLDNYEGNIEATVYEANEILNTTRLHVDPR
ncbi:MAG: AAA family ATPase [Spirosomataceae bacterium]